MHGRSDQHLVPFLLFVLLLLLLLGSIRIVVLGKQLRGRLFDITIDVAIAIPELHFLESLQEQLNRLFLLGIKLLFEFLPDFLENFDLMTCLDAHLPQLLSRYICISHTIHLNDSRSLMPASFSLGRYSCIKF